MQDRDFYQQIIGLKSPWSVSKVALDVVQYQVDVFSGTNVAPLFKWFNDK